MFDDSSAVSQVQPTLIRIGKEKITVDFNSHKLKAMLRRYSSFPVEHRKQIWTYILQLPNNKEAFQILLEKPQMPHSQRLVEQKRCKKRIVPIINALIHWHAPLINCEWLPVFVQKLDNSFGSDPLFCFEVTVTFLTNFFGEWLSDVPGPPPEILSRIDAIFTNYDPILRDGLGSGLVAWPVYRSCFAEILYDRSWLELMDNILSSSPQFFEFLVVAWMIANSRQLRVDHQTFHKAMRPIDVEQVVKIAHRVVAFTPPNLFSHAWFHPLPAGHYPLIEASSDTVALRTIQSDQDKLIILQQQLRDERAKADAAELTQRRKNETFNAISALVQNKGNQERVEAAKAAGDLSTLLNRLRLEGKRLKQTEEKAFLDNWMNDWSHGIDMTMTSLPIRNEEDDEIINQQEVRLSSLNNLRQADLMARESRKVSISRGKHAIGEIEAQTHKMMIQNEITSLNENPDLLLKVGKI